MIFTTDVVKTEHNSYPNTSVKRPPVERECVPMMTNITSGHLLCFLVYGIVFPILGVIVKKGIHVREYRRAIENGQSTEAVNIGCTKRRQTKNTIYVGHYYAQTYTSVFI